MKEYSVILFDLDGTIINPKLGIVNSVQYAANQLQIEVTEPTLLENFIGPPLLHSFRKYFSLTESEARTAIDHFRIYFRQTGIRENHLYPGIKKLLEDLAQQNRTLYVATSKPTPFACDILEHYNLSHLFEEIVGSNLNLTRTAKTEIIGYILNKYPKMQSNTCVMIGDRSYDIIGAQNNQIDSVGVLWGYGSEDEIISMHPTFIVKHINDLRQIFLESK